MCQFAQARKPHLALITEHIDASGLVNSYRLKTTIQGFGVQISGRVFAQHAQVPRIIHYNNKS
jgi:hypothetical protein